MFKPPKIKEPDFESILEFENLYAAYTDARKCKSYRSSILKFSSELGGNLVELQNELKNRTYKHGGYREFIVNDSKKRLIKAAPFRDRVVHHAVCNIIEPIFEKIFIYDSYACRSGKGTHRAVLRVESFVKSLEFSERETKSPCNLLIDDSNLGDININSGFRVKPGTTQKADCKARKIYCLKCDISKYFDNVDHDILFGLLRKKIWDKDILWLLWEIIESNSRGIPIGNLTSQLFTNVYLNELDHFVKR